MEKKMPSRLGVPQSYKTKVAAQLNWLNRMIKGAKGTTSVHSNFYWIRRHPEFHTALTAEQEVKLDIIEIKVKELRTALENVEAAIADYYLAPKTPMPKRERQKAQRAAQKLPKAAENLEVP